MGLALWLNVLSLPNKKGISCQVFAPEKDQTGAAQPSGRVALKGIRHGGGAWLYSVRLRESKAVLAGSSLAQRLALHDAPMGCHGGKEDASLHQKNMDS